jgi:hypothetical protein
MMIEESLKEEFEIFMKDHLVFDLSVVLTLVVLIFCFPYTFLSAHINFSCFLVALLVLK